MRELYAIEHIDGRLEPGNPLFEEARDRFEEAEARFGTALSAAYNRLYFPAKNPETECDALVVAPLDPGLQLGRDAPSAERQIENLLAGPRADYKLVTELSKDILDECFAQAETYLWPSGQDTRRTPWRDIVRRAKSSPIWPWMPGARGLR